MSGPSRSLARGATALVLLLSDPSAWTASVPSGAGEAQEALPLHGSLVERSQVELVLVPVSVRSRAGLPVEGLGPDDFVLYEDGVMQDIATFDSDPTPVSLVLALDCSGSMAGLFPLVQAGAIRFVGKLPPSTVIAVVGFGREPRLLCDFSLDRDHVFYSINRARADEESTALMGASRVAVDLLHGRPGRRGAVVFTDGGDTLVPPDRLEDTAKRILSRARAAGAMMFFVLYGPGGGKDLLEGIAAGTGGMILRPGIGSGIVQAFERIARDLNCQYTLGYHPLRPGRPGEWRRLRVEVKRAEVIVAARPGYALQ